MSQENIDQFAGFNFFLIVEPKEQMEGLIVLGSNLPAGKAYIAKDVRQPCVSCRLNNMDDLSFSLMCAGLERQNNGTIAAEICLLRKREGTKDIIIETELENLNPPCQSHIDNNQPTPRGVRKSKK